MLGIIRSPISSIKSPMKNATKLAISGFSTFLKEGDEQVYIDPTYDYAFKRLFAHEGHKDVTISFLNALLFAEGPQIEELDIISPQLPRDFADQLDSTVDVRCRLSDDAEILIEMQGHSKSYFIPRTQYYLCRAFANTLVGGQGKNYHKAPELYSLVIGKGTIFTTGKGSNLQYRDLEGNPKIIDDTGYKLTVEPVIKEHSATFSKNKLFWVYYQLSHFDIESPDVDESSPAAQWLDFLKTCATRAEAPSNIEDAISKAYDIMYKQNWTKDMLEAYDVSVYKRRIDEIYTESAAINDAREEGLEKGRDEGREEAMLAVAQSLFESGDDIKKVHQVTGIAQSRLQELQITLSGSKREYHTVADIPDYDDAATEIDFSSSVLGEMGLMEPAE